MKNTDNEPKQPQAEVSAPKSLPKWSINKKIVKKSAMIVALILVLVGGVYGYSYATTPAHIRKPTYQHYHFRTQLLVDGKAVDFSRDQFQEEIVGANTCSAAVGGVPIDFHDNMDQVTHVHWGGMTGGEFLKYFGWNFIGEDDNLLGHRYDAGLIPKSVEIYGKLLPNVPENSNFYVYTGDMNDYQKKNWRDFLDNDLETFFGKKSNIGHNDELSSTSVLSWLIPKASAHGEIIDEHPSTKSEEELTAINNLIGNVVIFAQEKEPTNEQIETRFDNLVPLHESSCGE